MREIITLQLGNFSNFVGSHFWNMQHEQLQQSIADESRFGGVVSHDVLFQYSETRNGQAIRTPRLVLFDLRGSLERPLGHKNDLTDDQYKAIGQASWTGGDVEVHRVDRGSAREQHLYRRYLSGAVDVLTAEEVKEAREAAGETEAPAAAVVPPGASASDGAAGSASSGDSNLQERLKVTRDEMLRSLDEETRTWSDFQRAEFHPRSMHELKYYEKDINDFDAYTIGSQVLERQDEMDEIAESIRFFLEDCDSLRAFQLMTDTGDSWGALSKGIINRVLRDELSSKTPVMVIGCSPFHYVSDFPTPADHDKMVLNSALSFADLYTESNVMFPISAQMLAKDSFPYVHIDPHNRYHSSAILAAAIDTATLPLRLERDYTDVVDFCNSLAVLPAMKVSTICTALPLPVQSGKSFYDTLAPLQQIHRASIFVPLSPMVKRAGDDVPSPYSQIATVRGVSDTPLYPFSETLHQKQHASVEAMMKLLLGGRGGSSKQEMSNRHTLENRALADQESHREMWGSYVEQVHTYKTTSNLVSQGLPIPDSFPMRTLSSRLTDEGLIAAEDAKGKQDILRLPHATHVQTTRQISSFVQHLHDNMVQQTKRGVPTQYGSITREHLAEYKETLLKLVDDYEE